MQSEFLVGLQSSKKSIEAKVAAYEKAFADAAWNVHLGTMGFTFMARRYFQPKQVEFNRNMLRMIIEGGL